MNTRRSSGTGPQQKTTFGRHRDAAWYFDRLQTFLWGAYAIGQKGREIHVFRIAPGWEAKQAGSNPRRGRYASEATTVQSS